jgi:hypothetical protein
MTIPKPLKTNIEQYTQKAKSFSESLLLILKHHSPELDPYRGDIEVIQEKQSEVAQLLDDLIFEINHSGG